MGFAIFAYFFLLLIPAVIIGLITYSAAQSAVRAELVRFFNPQSEETRPAQAPCPRCGRVNYFREDICPGCSYSFVAAPDELQQEE